MKPVLCLLLLAALTTAQAQTASKAKAKPANPAAPAYAASVPKPILSGVRYGTHERHVLDLWKTHRENFF